MVTKGDAEKLKMLGDSVEMVEKMSPPRYVKTHLPWELLPMQLREKKIKV